MSALYIFLLPLCIIVLYKSVIQITQSIKNGNSSKLKGDIFFLTLIVLVISGLVFTIEYV